MICDRLASCEENFDDEERHTSTNRSNAHRASSVGGGLIASQSATAKYCHSRQHRGKIDTAEASSMQDAVVATTAVTDQGGNLRTNPSVTNYYRTTSTTATASPAEEVLP